MTIVRVKYSYELNKWILYPIQDGKSQSMILCDNEPSKIDIYRKVKDDNIKIVREE